MREVADNPEMIIANQVEREPSAILRRFVGSAACDRDVESVHGEPLQGVDERLRDCFLADEVRELLRTIAALLPIRATLSTAVGFNSSTRC